MHLETLIAAADSETAHVVDRAAMASALRATGNVAYTQGDDLAAQAYYLRCLDIERQRAEPASLAAVLDNLGVVESALGQHAAAAEHHREGLAYGEIAGDEEMVAAARINLGVAAMNARDMVRAREALAGAVEDNRRLGHLGSQARALALLGEVHADFGEMERCLAAIDGSLGLMREIGDRSGQAHALLLRGFALRLRGALDEAETDLHASADLAKSLGGVLVMADAWVELGRVAQMRGDPAAALPLYDRAAKAFADIGHPLGWLTLRRASVAVDRGDIVLARRGFSEAVACFEAEADEVGIARARAGWAIVECLAGNPLGGGEHARAAVQICLRLGWSRHWLEVLEAVAAVAARAGDGDVAASLVSVAESRRVALGLPRGTDLDRVLAKLGVPNKAGGDSDSRAGDSATAAAPVVLQAMQDALSWLESERIPSRGGGLQ
jgi:tetratricopeptide (TPR) repeat protein